MLSFDTPRGRASRHFFLEADRATMPGRRKGYLGTSLYKKFVGYWNWYRVEKEHRNYGMPGFIVLTTTTTLERARNLRAIARDVDDRKTGSHMFWFTGEDQYQDDIKNLGQPIWLSAGDNPDDIDQARRTHNLIESSHTTR